MMSKPTVSEATTKALPFRPMARGRNPAWSRAAMSPLSVRITSENAPSTAAIASRIWSICSVCRLRAIRWRITSVSEVVWKIVPSS